MKVAATITAHDFQLTVDGFDDVRGGKGFARVLGVVQERQVVFRLLAETAQRRIWTDAHPMIILEVRADGKAEKWLVGGPAINRMQANGWTKATVKPGDTITGVGYQFGDGQKIIRLERVFLADGKEIRVYGR